MTPSLRFSSDAEFEAEVRAMLERRAADVPATRPLAGAVTHPRDERATVVDDAIIVRLDAPLRRGRRRIVLVAAVIALAVGTAGLTILVRGGGTTPASRPTDVAGAPTAIWPLTDAVSRDLLATPESATRAYLAAEVSADADIQVGATDRRGVEATVDYTLEGIPAAVTLLHQNGSWFVTGASNELMAIDQVSGPHGTQLDVEVVQGEFDAPVPRLRAQLVGEAGVVGDTADVEFEHGVRVEDPGQPLADGSWGTYLFVGADTDPVAVRVDVLTFDRDIDRVIAHASVPVPVAHDDPDDGTDEPSLTAAPVESIDPNPEPIAPEPDPIPALSTLEDPNEPVTGDARGTEGWQDAATELLSTTVDENLPSGPPTFTDVVVDAGSLTVQGRYTMSDGDVGAFEVVRLNDGTWGITSLRSDAIEIVAVGRTGTGVQVTLLSTRDAELGIGSGRVGRAPDEPWIVAGQPAVLTVPCDGTARMFQYLRATDGTALRIAEAWPC